MTIEVHASPVGAGDNGGNLSAGGAGGAGGACRRNFRGK